MTVMWAGGLALMLGALHALEPGHGKAAIAAYMVGRRGSLRHVLVLGLSTALAHTGVIIALALLLGVAAEGAAGADDAHHWFEYVSAALLIVVGCWMPERARRRPRPSPNDSVAVGAGGRPAGQCGCEAHSTGGSPRNDPLSYRFAGVLGLTGGIIPCPSAIAALLSTAAAGRFAYGVWSVVLFSVGIALTLSCVALLARCAGQGSRDVLAKLLGGEAAQRWAQRAPLVSASLVLLCGIYSLRRAALLG